MHVPKPSEVKTMFGNRGAFVNKNMFAGTFGPIVWLKPVTPASRDEFAAVPGTGPFGSTGRPMGGYLALPGERTAREDDAAHWVERAILEVAELPPGMPKSPGKHRRRAT